MTTVVKKERVIVVDDDPIFCSAMSACLLKAEIDVELAHDGLDALERIKPGLFVAALIDLDMPRIDGPRLIGLLRGNRRLDAMAIIIVSGSQNLELYQSALGLGADNFLVKPMDWRRLALRVRHEVNRRRVLAELMDLQWRILTSSDARPTPDCHR